MLGFEPEKIFVFSKKALLSIIVTGLFFIYYFTMSEFSENVYHTSHLLFLISLLVSLSIAIIFKIFSVIAEISVVYVGFIIITTLRYMYGEDYIFSAAYNVWSMLFIPNLLLASMFFQKKEKNKYWSWFYIFLFLETAVIEKLQNPNTEADSYYFYKHIGMVNYPAFYISLICLFILLCYYIKNGKILSGTIFFVSLSIFTGLYLSNNLSAFSLFFLAAGVVELVSLLFYLYYIRFKDENLNIFGIKGLLYETEEKCPLKYTMSLLYIDDYERLQKRFGYYKMLLLKKMFVNQIKKINHDVLIYNYKKDALILVFPGETSLASFEKAENIRRMLVKSIFVFNENNHLQLTVSQCISEKKRSDLNAIAVLERAEENLQKACRFTRNITIKG